MKKVVLLFLIGFLLISCGGDKKKERGEAEVEIGDKYKVVLDAIYEKDDSMTVVYKKDGYWDYDHPEPLKITGQRTMQQVVVEVPSNFKLDNIHFNLSTNTQQKTLKLTGISVFNNEKKIIDGTNMAFIKYFNTGTGLSWDDKNLRYNLIFGGEYPPQIVGNDVTESMLVK